MTDISIPRFLPTGVSREKVNSAQAGSNDDDRAHSWSESSEQEGHGEDEEIDLPSSGPPADEQQLETAVARLNDYVQTIQRDIIFGIDLGANEPSVTVVDRKSRKLVRQFGGQEALELAKKIDAQEPLCLFKAQV